MKTKSESTINFAYFTANFTPDFIQKCWAGNPVLIEHLTFKFLSKSNNSCFITMGGFMEFFMELSDNNKRQLVDWIDLNYNYYL